jgi:hypothetical protein
MDDEFELIGELDCETDDACTSVLRARERAGVAIADLRLMTTPAGERGRGRPRSPAGIGHGVGHLPHLPRARWVDATPAFWAMIHGQGHFPLTCPVCGHPLPQWKVREGDETRCRG